MINTEKGDRILIVDDALENVQLLGNFFKKEGYEINIAQNGLQALDVVKVMLPDLILLDIMMPELDGYEACKRLKADPKTADIPIIFLTAKVETEDIVKGFKLGAVDYLTKPFQTQEVLVRIETHLSLRRMSKKLDEKNRKLEKANEVIKSSLNEKETLLHEIHHRVKNNMAIISSLLNLQAANIQDERLKAVLKDSQSRIQSMSAIHETLYQSDNLSAIDTNKYLSKLAKVITKNFTIDKKINLKLEVENVMIGARQASPLGLIVNELITNSFKYAFSDDQIREIVIKLSKLKENVVELIVSDNGIGMPQNSDWENSKSLGLRLVKSLAENQFGGSLKLDSTNGTKFTIKFNIES